MGGDGCTGNEALRAAMAAATEMGACALGLGRAPYDEFTSAAAPAAASTLSSYGDSPTMLLCRFRDVRSCCVMSSSDMGHVSPDMAAGCGAYCGCGCGCGGAGVGVGATVAGDIVDAVDAS